METIAQQARRALSESTSRAAEARGLAAGAGDVGGEAAQIASEAAGKITQSGNDIANTARRDAQTMADKFRAEGETAAQEFVTLGNQGQQDIAQIQQNSTNPKIADVAELERLISLTEDVPQLERMLVLMPNGSDLQVYLKAV